MPEDRHDMFQTIESVAELMLVLAELEAASEQMVDVYFQSNRSRAIEDTDRYRIHQIRQIVGDAERQARSIRAYLTRLTSTIITRNTNEDPGLREVERLGFEGYVGPDSIELSVPYPWISCSSAFIYTVKKYPHWNSMTSATDVWHWVMEGALKKLEPFVPFKLPLEHAQIDIVMFKPRARVGDPDHFWYRPIVDAFKQRRFIVNDDAMSLQIRVGYKHDANHPEVRIRLGNPPENRGIDVRNEGLKKVF